MRPASSFLFIQLSNARVKEEPFSGKLNEKGKSMFKGQFPFVIRLVFYQCRDFQFHVSCSFRNPGVSFFCIQYSTKRLL